jgi:hypothetical protein
MVKQKVNITSIEDILGGDSQFTVEVYGMVTGDVRRESITANFSEGRQFKGRSQMIISDCKGLKDN